MEFFTPAESQRHNQIVQNWLLKGRRAYQSGTATTPTGSGTLASSWKTGTKKEEGTISQGRFIFARHGIFREMGVFGGLTKKQAKRLGKLNPHPLVNPWIEENLEDLARDLAKNNALAVLNATRLKIKNA